MSSKQAWGVGSLPAGRRPFIPVAKARGSLATVLVERWPALLSGKSCLVQVSQPTASVFGHLRKTEQVCFLRQEQRRE
jgi:hypothetical protein